MKDVIEQLLQAIENYNKSNTDYKILLSKIIIEKNEKFINFIISVSNSSRIIDWFPICIHLLRIKGENDVLSYAEQENIFHNLNELCNHIETKINNNTKNIIESYNKNEIYDLYDLCDNLITKLKSFKQNPIEISLCTIEEKNKNIKIEATVDINEESSYDFVYSINKLTRNYNLECICVDNTFYNCDCDGLLSDADAIYNKIIEYIKSIDVTD